MLPEAGATELIFLGIVALIVVGPKDLPMLLRKVGQFTAKMRGLAAEFRSSFDELARQSELDELRKEVDALRHGQTIAPVQKEIERHFEDLHAEFNAPPPPPLTAEGVIVPGPDAATPVQAAPATPASTTAAALHADVAAPEAVQSAPLTPPEGTVPASPAAVMRPIPPPRFTELGPPPPPIGQPIVNQPIPNEPALIEPASESKG